MDNEIRERRPFASFEKLGNFIELQQTLLALDLFEEPSEEDSHKEWNLYKQLTEILMEYQEQSYLLDPYLETLVVPVADHLRFYAKTSVQTGTQGARRRVLLLTDLLHSYIKFRGYKPIIRFFPHEVGDLSIALQCLLQPEGLIQDSSMWSLRYTILLWLSLICMIPFDLAQFDEVSHTGNTASAIESAAKRYLGRAGLDRDGAALLLSRLYMRADTSPMFDPFLTVAMNQLSTNCDVFMTIGILQTLCEVVKSGPVELIEPRVSLLFTLSHAVERASSYPGNTTIRKLRVKFTSRIALRLLPPTAGSNHWRGRTLTGFVDQLGTSCRHTNFDVPEEVEIILQQLFDALKDRDTVVRWSAAKAVARLSERLPADFADQVVETILGLFSIHGISTASLYNLPAIAEGTWHGACLACAETARRGLMAPERLPELLGWLSKALYFDIRKGAHSIGSNVRDAAAYALWALARTQVREVLAAHAIDLACRLTTVALFDREVHIRRAASAAFQEHVGRNSLFPRGIDVLSRTDFYAVSIRRNAFLVAAPQVAQYPEYRFSLIDHILEVVLRHWDPDMRELGAQSLRFICKVDPTTLAPLAAKKVLPLLESVDIVDLHGGLLALAEISLACRDYDGHSLNSYIEENFRALNKVSLEVVTGPRSAIITSAACLLISVSVTRSALDTETSPVPPWMKIVEHGLKHRASSVQEAAARAMGSISKLTDCSQSLGTLLASIDYSSHFNGLHLSIQSLIQFLKPSPVPKSNIEARRNCYFAFPKILLTIKNNLSTYVSAETMNTIYDTLIGGLDDYSSDSRGDVGSWVRIACVKSLVDVTVLIMQESNSFTDLASYLPPEKFHFAVAGILKQAVERLDNVRQIAGQCFLRILNLPLPDPESWRLPGLVLLNELFSGEKDVEHWGDGSWLFPKVVQLLEIPEYRQPLLSGFILSLSSKTESTQRPLATSITSYVHSLPMTSDSDDYDVNTLLEDLILRIQNRMTFNSAVIPVLQTLNILLEGDALHKVSKDPHGIENLRKLILIVGTNVSRLKNVTRIQESMKIVVNLMAMDPLFAQCTAKLADFLSHHFPSVRRNTAEYLYVVLQGLDMQKETDEVEQLLLEIEWSSEDPQAWKDAAEHIPALLIG